MVPSQGLRALGPEVKVVPLDQLRSWFEPFEDSGGIWPELVKADWALGLKTQDKDDLNDIESLFADLGCYLATRNIDKKDVHIKMHYRAERFLAEHYLGMLNPVMPADTKFYHSPSPRSFEYMGFTIMVDNNRSGYVFIPFHKLVKLWVVHG